MRVLSAAFFSIVFLAPIGFAQNVAEPKRTVISTLGAINGISGWDAPGDSQRGNYEILLDSVIKQSGNRSVSIRSIGDDPAQANNTFIRQQVSALEHAGKRIRFSAFIKAENVEGANLWMQVTGSDLRVLNDDRMKDRSVLGTSDWKKYEIVLDVPTDSRIIILGVSLSGKGRIWIDDLRFEAVSKDIPSTGQRPAKEIEAESLSYIQRFKSTNPGAYEAGLQAQLRKTKSLPSTPINPDFEN